MNHTTPGYDKRGKARDRRVRRRWLLSSEAGFSGNGESVPCFHCRIELNYRTLEVDRFPVCGHDGGTYRRGNIVPSCRYCNVNRCPRCLGAIAARGGLLERQTRLPFGQSEWPDLVDLRLKKGERTC